MYMINMKWNTVFMKEGGRTDKVGPSEAIWIIDEHPAIYVARAKQKLSQLYRDGKNDRADEILSISVVAEVPEGMLTEEQIDSLS
jgi:hypothetical protein